MNKIQKEVLIGVGWFIGFMLSVMLGFDLGEYIFKGDVYGELKPFAMGISTGALYNLIILFIALGKVKV